MLAGCGSQPTAAEPSREAGNLGTRVCLVNKTTLNASVVFTTKDTAQEGAFPPGTQLCGEGTFGLGPDVAGEVIWTTPSWTTKFSASNVWVGNPEATVFESLGGGKKMCLSKGFQINESMTGDNGVVQMNVIRLADGQWKEFEVVFSPSANPSADGSRGMLQGYRPCTEKSPPTS